MDQEVMDSFDQHVGMNSQMSPSAHDDGISRYATQDKQIVKSALKDLKNNYKQIEIDIELATK